MAKEDSGLIRMNYRHIYHAGNFSDVFKHLLLLSLLQSLMRKEKPFSYIETHAGIGRYDLQKEAAQKSKEFSGGILKLWKMSDQPMPDLVRTYIQQIQNFNRQNSATGLRYYPGSPHIARDLLRSGDRMILCELHARDIISLKNEFRADAQVAVHHMDGYQGLKAFLPPQPARGLVFIDPSYEQSDEFNQVAQQLQEANRRWPMGIFAAWYPIKDRKGVDNFYKELQDSGMRDLIYCEFALPFSVTSLTACGMIVLRPPWQWQQEVEKLLAWLSQALSAPAVGSWQFKCLVPE